MGDRGNIFFVDRLVDGNTFGGMYMYSHWGGSSLPAVVAAALDHGRGRWGDSQYFARIMFCRLIEDDVDGTTGYGLSTEIGDNGQLVIRVDDLNNRISYHEPGTETEATNVGVKSWSYDEFVDGDLDEIMQGFATH